MKQLNQYTVKELVDAYSGDIDINVDMSKKDIFDEVLDYEHGKFNELYSHDSDTDDTQYTENVFEDNDDLEVRSDSISQY